MHRLTRFYRASIVRADRGDESLSKGRPTSNRAIRTYAELLATVKDRIRAAQTRAVLSANAELIRLYWDIGRLIQSRRDAAGWGAAVIPKLARDIRIELPGVKGFSERNIGYMIRFAREYPILQQPAAKLLPRSSRTRSRQPGAPIDEQLLCSIPWFHHVVLMEKIKDLPARIWYMQHTIQGAWSRGTLQMMIKSQAHRRQGQAITNFSVQLPPAQSDLAVQTLKDPYIFDFLTLEEPFHERELELQLLAHLEKFLIELGQGFAFVGRQYHLSVGGNDFSIDLLFYQLKLRCFFVIDLKIAEFKAEYAGKMNFYLGVVDDLLRHPSDAPTIGLILCQDRNRVVAEYALRGMQKPIGVSEYELTRALPKELQSSLPTIEQIEAELGTGTKPAGRPNKLAGRRSSKRKGSR